MIFGIFGIILIGSFLIMSETDPFLVCLRTSSVFLSVNYLFIVFAHFVLIVALFLLV